MEILVNLRRGKIHHQPIKCPDDVYGVMKSCWEIDPSIRDTAMMIEEKITSLITAPAPNPIGAVEARTLSSRIMILRSLGDEDEDEMHL